VLRMFGLIENPAAGVRTDPDAVMRW
jgi:hypothetical protein